MLKRSKRSPRFRFFNPQQPLFIAHWNNRSTIGQSSALLLPLLLPKSRYKPASSRAKTYFPSTSETVLHIPSQHPSAFSPPTLFKNPDASTVENLQSS
jgi:hypothetical protein